MLAAMMKDTIERAISDARLHELSAERHAQQARLERLQRERHEVSQAISMWDRIVFFSRTPDEARARELKKSLKQGLNDLAATNDKLSAAVEQIAASVPPFAVARDIDTAARIARHELRARRGFLVKEVVEQDELIDALRSLARRLLSTWLVGFDSIDFFRAVYRGEGSAADAPKHVELVDPDFGHAPITVETLAALVRGALDRAGFPAAQREHRAATDALEQARADYRTAQAAVSWLDKLNVFRRSDSEFERDEQEARFVALHEELERSWHRLRHRIHEGLRAYPVLDLHQHVLEVLTAARLTKYEAEPAFDRAGELSTHHAAAFRAVLLRSLGALETCFAETFPGVPLPSQLGLEAADTTAPSRHGQLVISYFAGLESSRAGELLDRCRQHAVMAGRASWRLEDLRDRISFFDRLVFWSDTEDEALADTLDEHRDWNRDWAAHLWEELLGEARAVGSEFGPFATRDAALLSAAAIGQIHTDAGESSFPKSCTVYGREDTLNHLADVQGALKHFYGIDGSIGSLLQETANATPADTVVRGDALHGVGKLSRAELVGVLAHELRGTDFRAALRRSTERIGEVEQVSAERASIASKISIWDKVNIFSTTADEQRKSELDATVDAMMTDRRNDITHVMALFREAVQRYPPAALYFALSDIIDAVNNIRAVCRSRTTTVGSGKNRRTVTRYYCQLLGKGEAIGAMERWSRLLTASFGTLPTYHELVDTWQLRAIGADGPDLDAV